MSACRGREPLAPGKCSRTCRASRPTGLPIRRPVRAPARPMSTIFARPAGGYDVRRLDVAVDDAGADARGPSPPAACNAPPRPAAAGRAARSGRSRLGPSTNSKAIKYNPGPRRSSTRGRCSRGRAAADRALGLEPRHALRIGRRSGRKDFEATGRLSLHVAGTKHRRHAAGADRLDQFEVSGSPATQVGQCVGRRQRIALGNASRDVWS